MWYAGIDWADEHHDAVVLDEQGQRVASCRVTHTPEGLAQLVTFLQGTVGSAPTSQELACLIETTRGLLITALLDAGLVVYPVNPRRWTGGASRRARRRMRLTPIYSPRSGAATSPTCAAWRRIARWSTS